MKHKAKKRGAHAKPQTKSHRSQVRDQKTNTRFDDDDVNDVEIPGNDEGRLPRDVERPSRDSESKYSRS